MVGIIASVLLAFTARLPPVETARAADSPSAHAVFVDVPKSPNGLTLYNGKGEVVARCRKTGDSFHDCMTEPGVTLDDLMNAWVHAYLEVQK